MLLNIVIVGGGATGVEIAGAVSEMKRYVIPRDYPDMDASHMHIYLLEAGDRLLAGMSKESSDKALKFLRDMGLKLADTLPGVKPQLIRQAMGLNDLPAWLR